MDDHDLSAAVSVVAGRELLRRVVTLLAPTPVVALKGVVISALTEGTGTTPRRMIDVDVLIPESTRDEAERRLRAAGFKTLCRNATATTLRPADLPLDLDLHVRLTQPGLFALDEAAIIERSQELPAVFACAARVPNRHDLYAHLVAHFVRNRSNAHDRRRLNDLAVVAHQLPMDASQVATHLHHSGLARAARYVLRLAAPHDAFARDVLAQLPPDVVGDVVTSFATRWLEVRAGNAKLAIPATHLLNYSLGAGARSFSSHLGDRALRAVRVRT
jgi:hypothetical protein